MKIAYVSQYDARDVKNWSGTGFNMAKMLEQQGALLDYVGPLKNQRNPINIAKYLWNTKVAGRGDQPQRDPGFLKHYAHQVEQRLTSSDADVIFAPGGLPISQLNTALPVALWTDCTFANLLNYYPKFSNLSARSIKNGHTAEQHALDRCDLMLFSSQWAADSAIKDYGVDPSRVHIVPLGSNMSPAPQPHEIEDFVAQRLQSLPRKMTLFCAGVDWRRKGVDVAVDVVNELNRRNIPTELLVAGCRPPEGETIPDSVKLLGFLSKNEETGRQRLAELFAQSHWFILPTRADCTPIVFAEAAQFGLPSLSVDTGGVASVIGTDINGRLFAADASPNVWADYIESYVRQPDRYAALCRSSYAEYQRRLNWTAAGERVMTLLEELLSSRRGSAKPAIQSRSAELGG